MHDGAPQRHGVEPATTPPPPGHGTEFAADTRQMLARVVKQLGWKRTGTDTRGVGLHDTENVIEGAGPQARTGRRAAGGSVRRGHERIGTHIDIEHRTLGAFEQHVRAFLLEPGQSCRDINQQRPQARRELQLLIQRALEVQRTLDEQLQFAARLRPLLVDVTATLAGLKQAGANVLFEGAQCAMRDVDVGTYPFVTSSNTTAGGAATGTGLGPCAFDDVLGIVKAYTTRVGAGPFPTELFDDSGEHLSRDGREFGSVTGRRRRCGWFDAVALRRAIVHSSVSSLCMTKLDVLDGLDTIRICVGYRLDGQILSVPPLFVDAYAEAEPVYEEMAGWKDSTVGLKELSALPLNAQRYLARIEELVGVPLDLISTGPDRDQTIIRRHPFDR